MEEKKKGRKQKRSRLALKKAPLKWRKYQGKNHIKINGM